jgi:RES domain-containing protein
VILYRIATATRQFPADDLSGKGAGISPGRWNEAGQAALYAAHTRALAVLETAAHVNAGGLPLNKYLVEISIDAQVWRKRIRFAPGDLPVGWDAIPAGQSSVRIGSGWLTGTKAALLEIPSVIIPEERAVVINPAHPDAKSIKARKVRLFEYDRLFR